MKAIATKDEERKALEQIEDIVNGLGPDSYLAATFAGCFEQARMNIDDDAAFNYKEEAERLEKQEREATLRARDLEAQVDHLTAELRELENEGVSYKDQMEIADLLGDYRETLEEQKQAEAEKVLANCTRPDSDEFKAASEKYGQLGYREGKVERAIELLCK